MSGHVFISYSRADRRYVDLLSQHLAVAHIPFWYDYEVEAGDRFASVIAERITTSSAVIVVQTPSAVASEWVNRELGYAVAQRKPILPLLLVPSEPHILTASLHHESVIGGTMPSESFLARLRALAGVPAPSVDEPIVDKPSPVELSPAALLLGERSRRLGMERARIAWIAGGLAVALLLLGGWALWGRNQPSDPSLGKVGVIFPDARWEVDRDRLRAAFQQAGVENRIEDAHGDAASFVTIADQMLASGVTALVILNLDSASGKIVIDRARARNVPVIDYDRLTLGGGASYHVSYGWEAIGRVQGEGLVACLTAKGVVKPVVAELHGSRDDPAATAFKLGYDSVLQPKYDAKEYIKGPDDHVPQWSPATAAEKFETMLTNWPGDIDGVLAANDGLAGAVISVLRRHQLGGAVMVTGQDATVPALRDILLGDQCMTVYKSAKSLADAAADLAIKLARGERPTMEQSAQDPTTKQTVPAKLLTPLAITAKDVKSLVDDGYVAKADLCTGAVVARCDAAGIT